MRVEIQLRLAAFSSVVGRVVRWVAEARREPLPHRDSLLLLASALDPEIVWVERAVHVEFFAPSFGGQIAKLTAIKVIVPTHLLAHQVSIT